MLFLSHAAVAVGSSTSEYNEKPPEEFNLYDQPAYEDEYTERIQLRAGGGPPDDPKDPNWTSIPGGLFLTLGFAGIYVWRLKQKKKN